MPKNGLRITACAAVLILALGLPGASAVNQLQTQKSRVETALANIRVLERPGEDGLATVWDGNKYVQCRHMSERALHCEAGGVLMQPSLGHVLVPQRIARLAVLGWRLDPSFGNYVQTFAEDLPEDQIADRIMRALAEGYDADVTDLEVRTDWIVSEPCPPRNGPTQNLAGVINDAPAMAATAVHACAYTPPPSLTTHSAAELTDAYGTRVTGEIQRLRINAERRVFVVLQADTGYVQCEPQTSPPAIYCEAQSADSWPVLTHILTPERIAHLHAAGFTDPGRAPNYWKIYPVGAFGDAAIASELLMILHDVYDYTGSPKLEIATEKGGD
jgi:hypothetical protein